MFIFFQSNWTFYHSWFFLQLFQGIKCIRSSFFNKYLNPLIANVLVHCPKKVKIVDALSTCERRHSEQASTDTNIHVFSYTESSSLPRPRPPTRRHARSRKVTLWRQKAIPCIYNVVRSALTMENAGPRNVPKLNQINQCQPFDLWPWIFGPFLSHRFWLENI